MASPHCFGLLYKATTTGGGPSQIDGAQMLYAMGVGPTRHGYGNKYWIQAWMDDTVTGATCTLQIQDSPDNSTWTTQKSFALATPAAAPFRAVLNGARVKVLFATARPFWRINISALAGGSAPAVSAYAMLYQKGL